MNLDYRQAVLADRPRAYWPMDEVVSATTVAQDISGHGHHSAYTGDSSRVEKCSPRPGGGRGYDLAGASYFEWATSARQTGTDYTRECWLSTGVTGSNMFLLAQYGATNGEDFWSYKLDDTMWVFMFNGGFVFNSGDGGAAGVPLRRQNTHDKRPHHIVYTRANAGRVRVYIDGDTVYDADGGTSASPLLDTSAGVTGMQLVDSTNFFNGVLSDAAIYDYALSRDQVLRHYQIGRGLYVPGSKDRRR